MLKIGQRTDTKALVEFGTKNVEFLRPFSPPSSIKLRPSPFLGQADEQYLKKLAYVNPGQLLSSPTIELGCILEEEEDDEKRPQLNRRRHTKP